MAGQGVASSFLEGWGAGAHFPVLGSHAKHAYRPGLIAAVAQQKGGMTEPTRLLPQIKRTFQKMRAFLPAIDCLCMREQQLLVSVTAGLPPARRDCQKQQALACSQAAKQVSAACHHASLVAPSSHARRITCSSRGAPGRAHTAHPLTASEASLSVFGSNRWQYCTRCSSYCWAILSTAPLQQYATLCCAALRHAALHYTRTRSRADVAPPFEG